MFCAAAVSSLYAPAASAAEPAGPIADGGQAIPAHKDGILIFEVMGGSTSLSDGLLVLDRESALLMPLGALAAALELPVEVSDDRVEGRNAEGRPVRYDPETGALNLDGVEVALPRHERATQDGEIYLPLPALGAILGIRLEADREALLVTVTADRPLPYQLRVDRQGRRIFNDIDEFANAPVVATPYVALSPPAFDISAGIDIGRSSPKTQGRYDIRAGGDLLWMGYQAFVGSDGDGVPSNIRFTMERTDLDGSIGGITRLAVGDVFSPSLALGPRSTAGRGLYVTSEPLEQVSVFDRIDLRGELPAGFDVELYVNNILRGNQIGRTDGRYEFPAVPLSRGPNLVRLVFYGPRGERQEQVRTINVGSGQVPAGVTRFTAGAVEQDIALIRIRNDQSTRVAGFNGRGNLRAAVGLAHGVSEAVTLVGGVGTYTPDLPNASSRALANMGLRSAIGGLAVQADVATDSSGGGAAVLGLAGRALGVAFVGRHGEFRSGFIDEVSLFLDPSRAARRASDLRLDFDVLFAGTRRVPVSAAANYARYEDGSEQLIASARASVAVQRGFFSFGIERDQQTSANPALGGTRERTSLVIESDTTLDDTWQIRASGAIDLSAAPRAGTLSLTADRRFGDSISWRMGATHSYGIVSDTIVQTAANWRLPFGDFSLGGAFQQRDSVWRIAASFSLGLLHDPLSGRYQITRPGAATGGALALRALVPTTAARTERRIPGIAVYGGLRPAETDAEGHALISGLGGPRTRVRIDDQSVEDPYLRAQSAIIELRPRPGRTARYDYRMAPVSDAMLRVFLSLPDGGSQALAAVGIRLEPVETDSEARSARTQFDGSAFFESLPPGRWQVRLDPAGEQAGLMLAQPVEIIVSDLGGPIPTTDVLLVRRAP